MLSMALLPFTRKSSRNLCKQVSKSLMCGFVCYDFILWPAVDHNFFCMKFTPVTGCVTITTAQGNGSLVMQLFMLLYLPSAAFRINSSPSKSVSSLHLFFSSHYLIPLPPLPLSPLISSLPSSHCPSSPCLISTHVPPTPPPPLIPPSPPLVSHLIPPPPPIVPLIPPPPPLVPNPSSSFPCLLIPSFLIFP